MLEELDFACIHAHGERDHDSGDVEAELGFHVGKVDEAVLVTSADATLPY